MHSPKKKNTIFIDFDGTLIDISQRYYAVYKYIANKYIGEREFSKREYWRKRRSGISFMELIQQTYNISNINSLTKRYLSLIENRRFLCLDTKFEGVNRALKQIGKSYNVILVSLRRNRKNLNWQLKKMGLFNLFDNILSSPCKDSGMNSKEELIKHSIYSKVNKKFIAGDTEADITAGSKTGCHTIAVCSGMRNHGYLLNLSPDYLIKDISALKEVIRT